MTGKLGGILLQFPSYVVYKPFRSTTSSGPRSSSRATRSWSSSATAAGSTRSNRDETLAFLEARGLTHVIVDAPKTEAKNLVPDRGRADERDRLRPLPRPERGDVEQAHGQRGRALRLPLLRRGAARSGSSRCASWRRSPNRVFAMFNNNGRSQMPSTGLEGLDPYEVAGDPAKGEVAQAPANALMLRQRDSKAAGVPVA